MTLAMLWVLISHHKGLTLLLIVVIALVLIALIPLVKRLLRSINGDPDRVLMAADRRPCILRFRFAPHQPRPVSHADPKRTKEMRTIIKQAVLPCQPNKMTAQRIQGVRQGEAEFKEHPGARAADAGGWRALLQ